MSAVQLRLKTVLVTTLLFVAGSVGLAAQPEPVRRPPPPQGTVRPPNRAADDQLRTPAAPARKEVREDRRPAREKREGHKTEPVADEGTLVLTLVHTDAERVADHVKRLYGRGSTIRVSADEPGNILLVHGQTAEIQQVRQMVKQLEHASAAGVAVTRREVKVIPIEFADAQRVGAMIRELAPFSPQGPPPTIECDPRTNALLINAAPSDWEAIDTIVRAVDVRD